MLEIVESAGAITVPQIARARSTSRQNIQILVDRLKAERRVELIENPAHKRSALVRLTAEGRSWLSNGQHGQRHLLSRIESQLSQDEINTTVSALRKVQGLLSVQKPADRSSRQTSSSNHMSSPPREPSLVLRQEDADESEEFPVNLL